MANSICLIATTVLMGLALADYQIPSAWGTCRRGDPQIDECLRSAIGRAVEDLYEGNAALGVTPLDQLKISHYHVKAEGALLKMDFNMYDAKIDTRGTLRVENVKTDLANGKIFFELKAPNITIDGTYRVRGRILVVPINGEGQLTMKMYNNTMTVTIQGRKQKDSSGKDHFKAESFIWDINPDKTKFIAISKSRPSASKISSRVMSENDKLIMKEVRPGLSESFSRTFKQMADAVFDKVAFDDIFPE